jgi:hypothetical protein
MKHRSVQTTALTDEKLATMVEHKSLQYEQPVAKVLDGRRTWDEGSIMLGLSASRVVKETK